MNLIQNRALKQLLWIGIGAIVMFFAGLTSAYIVRRAEGNWVEFILPDWFLVSTITIIISSILLVVTIKKIKRDESVFQLIFLVFILGLLFAFFQINGWKVLTNQGVFLTGEGSNVAGSFLYVITLSHLVHLVGGLVALFITAIKAKRNRYSKDDYLGLELTITYWHFLGLLWIYIYVFLKYF